MGSRLLDMIAFDHHLMVNIEAMTRNTITDTMLGVARRTLQPGLITDLMLQEKSTEVVILQPTRLLIFLETINSDTIQTMDDTQSRLSQ
jgi:hypothetical protein